jgi:hypothetical protein
VAVIARPAVLQAVFFSGPKPSEAELTPHIWLHLEQLPTFTGHGSRKIPWNQPAGFGISLRHIRGSVPCRARMTADEGTE